MSTTLKIVNATDRKFVYVRFNIASEELTLVGYDAPKTDSAARTNPVRHWRVIVAPEDVNDLLESITPFAQQMIDNCQFVDTASGDVLRFGPPFITAKRQITKLCQQTVDT